MDRKRFELERDIRHLSHELHSGMLQEAGLARALSSYCEEFSTARGMTIRAEVPAATAQPT